MTVAGKPGARLQACPACFGSAMNDQGTVTAAPALNECEKQ
jgi:hypothetical protein